MSDLSNDKRDAVLYVIKQVADGKLVKAVCRDVGLRVGEFNWAITRDRQLAILYSQAREQRADIMAEEVIEIADNQEQDPQIAKNRIDSRKWLAAHHAPKTYGDRLDVNIQATLDVSAVLAEAQGRTLTMRQARQVAPCDMEPIIEAKVIDTIEDKGKNVVVPKACPFD